MMAQRWLALACIAALAACGPRAYPNPDHANVNETIEIGIPPARIPQAIRAIQADAAVDAPDVSMQIAPNVPLRQVTDVETEYYVAALADARAKGQTLASQLGRRLDAARSVTEVASASDQYAYANGATRAMKSAASESVQTVSAPANGVVTLAVTFDAGGVPVSVFGRHARTPAPASFRNATGIQITLNARASDMRAAQARLTTLERAIVATATRWGAHAADVVITNAYANSY
ncbi:MAG: SIMPL domain-containing protein [Candidatus Eremiobacteraeota bacterium]|nr:SIMPL domain-containing protein [Candidatus Eremiobacteraeota bacterium]